MKQLFFVGTIFACLSISITVQAIDKPTEEDFKLRFGGFITGKISDLGHPSKEAEIAIRKISNAIGFDTNITIMSARIEKYATALATRRGEKLYIVYDRNHRDWVRGTPSIGDLRVMAHEVGHHFSDLLTGYSKNYIGHPEELRADMFAGFALARMGFSMEQATEGMSNREATEWHPSGEDRKGVIEEGWRLGSLVNGFIPETKACKPGFTSSEIEVDYSFCRIVRQCSDNEPYHRLSCKGLDGKWAFKG